MSFMGTVEVKNVVTEGLSVAEIENLQNVMIDSFDVSNEAVRAEVSYITSGIMELSIPEEISEDEIVDAVTSTLADLLGIHPKDVAVTSVNLETGEVEYEISSDIFSETTNIQSTLDSFSIDDIEELMVELLPSITIDGNSVDENIEVDVSIVVDGSDASSIREARIDVESILNDMGYDVTETSFVIFHD